MWLAQLMGVSRGLRSRGLLGASSLWLALLLTNPMHSVPPPWK
jgi:hypothetical protein